MYTARVTPLGRLKSYHRELNALYQAALAQGRMTEARAIFNRRVRVKRAILVAQEFAPRGQPSLN